MPDQPAVLAQFRTKYGRLCVLTAKALQQRHAEHKVALAVQGKGYELAPVYVILRAHRRDLDRFAQACIDDGLTIEELAVMCRELRLIVESEWMLTLPMFSEIP